MASVLSAGTTSNTALNLSADTTGILQFQTNGTTAAVTIGTNQYVGIGTTSTSGSRLQVSDANSAIGALCTNGTVTLRDANSTGASNTVDVHIRPSSGKSGGITFTEDSVADRWSVGINNGVADLLFRSGAYNGTERMRLTSGGNVLLSTVGANINFATSSSSTVNYIGVPADGFSLELACQRGASQPFVYKLDFANGHVWSTAGSEKMRLSTGGQLGIAKSPAVTLDVNGAINYDSNTTVNGLNVVYRATFNDGTNRQLSGVGWQDHFGMLTIKGTGGTTNIPYFGNGGGGISYAGTALDPDAGTWTYGAGPTITFTNAGTGGNTFTVTFAGGTGFIFVQRTAGSGSFTIILQQFAT